MLLEMAALQQMRHSGATLRNSIHGVLAVSRRGRIEPPSHLTMSWCALAAGIACRWEWGGAQPTFWCPLPLRSTRHALNPRSLSFSDVESKLADGRGGPTSTSTRKKRLIVRDHSAPRSHPCSSQYAIEHACAPDLSPGIHHVVA